MILPKDKLNSEKRKAFIDWLVAETVSGFKRSQNDPESIKGLVFLYLNRAYEAGLPAEEITDILGVIPNSILNQANLPKPVEQLVLQAFEQVDPVVEKTYES